MQYISSKLTNMPDYDFAMYTICLMQYISSKLTNMLIAERIVPDYADSGLPDYDIAVMGILCGRVTPGYHLY